MANPRANLAQLVAYSGLLVGSSCFPAQTAVAGGLASAVAGVASGFVTSALEQSWSDIAQRLAGGDAVLENHDLTRAAGKAVAALLALASKDERLKVHQEKLWAMARIAQEQWLQEVNAQDFVGLQDAQLLEVLGAEVLLSVAEWRTILESLAGKTPPTVSGRLIREVVPLSEADYEVLGERVRQGFPKALREVLKEDFRGDGRAFAGVMLDCLKNLMAATRQGELSQDWQGLETLTRNLQAGNEATRGAIEGLWGEMQTGFAGLCARVGVAEGSIHGVLEDLSARLGEMQADVRETKGIAQDTHDLAQTILTEVRQSPLGSTALVELNAAPPPITDWQGRERELELLRASLGNERFRLITITAAGGYGKSALAARLYGEYATTAGWRCLWVTFNQAYGFAQFGGWLLQQLEKPYDERWDEATLMEQMVLRLGEQRCLLVLDNLETVVTAEGQSPYTDFLARWVGTGQTSTILLTSREQPPLSPNLLRRIDWLPLTGLAVDAAVAMAQDLGLRGTEAELETFVQQVGGHPLLLSLVAGLLWDAFGEDPAVTQVAGLGLNLFEMGGFHRDTDTSVGEVFAASVARLTPQLRQLLTQMSVVRVQFDGAMAGRMVPEVTEQELRALSRRSLLQESRPQAGQPRRFAFLPLMRQFAQAQAEDLRPAHALALHYYQSVLQPPPWNALADVETYLEAFYHACELGELQTAYDILNEVRGDAEGQPKDKSCNAFLNLQGHNRVRAQLYAILVAVWPMDKRAEQRFVNSLSHLGLCYLSLGQYQQAIDFHQQSLAIAREIGDRQGEGASLGNLGNCYYSLGQYQQAIDLHQQSLAIEREIGNRQGEGASLGSLGLCYDSLGQYEQAIEFHQQSLAIKREIGDRRGEANSLGNLGNCYYSLGQYEQAIDFHQQHNAIAREIGNRQGEGASLGNLGNCYYSLGQYQQAIDFHQQSLAIAREIGDRRGEGASLGNLGNCYYSLGQYQQAIDFYQKHNAIAREIGDRRGEANSLSGLGLCYYSLGQYQQAIDFHQQSLAIAREIGDRRGEANSLGNLGICYKSLGQYQQAIDFHQQHNAIAREIGDRRGEANSLGNLGNCYYSLGQYQQAIDFQQQWLAIAREIGDRQGEANSLGSLGLCYYSLGQYEQAIDFHQQYNAIAREIGDRWGEANSLVNLGNTFISLEKFAEAQDHTNRALQLFRDIDAQAGVAEALKNLGDIAFRTGALSQAQTHCQEALEIAQTLQIPLVKECEELLASIRQALQQESDG